VDGGASDAPTSAHSIAFVGVSTAHDDNQTIKQLELNQPQGAMSGDLLLAAIYLGNDSYNSLPHFTSPAGWTLVDQTNESSRGSLLVEWHVVGASEPPSYTWTSNEPVYGVGWVAAYRGVKVTDPIDAHVGHVDTKCQEQYAAPTATTTTPNALVVASFAGWTSDMGPHVWTCPTTMTLLANPNDGRERSGCGAGTVQAAPGATPALTATVSQKQSYAITHLLALKPAQ
jgi:hypothetical protein